VGLDELARLFPNDIVVLDGALVGVGLLGCAEPQEPALMIQALLVAEEHNVAFYAVVSDMAGGKAGQRACLGMRAGKGDSSRSIY
jgi:hypothetical protein